MYRTDSPSAFSVCTVSLFNNSTYRPRASRMPWLLARVNPRLSGLAMNRTHGNRRGSSATVSSLVVPLSIANTS